MAVPMENTHYLIEFLIGLTGMAGGYTVAWFTLGKKVQQLDNIERKVEDIQGTLKPGILPSTRIKIDSHEARICALEGQTFCAGHPLLMSRVEHIEAGVDRILDHMLEGARK